MRATFLVVTPHACRHRNKVATSHHLVPFASRTSRFCLDTMDTMEISKLTALAGASNSLRAGQRRCTAGRRTRRHCCTTPMLLRTARMQRNNPFAEATCAMWRRRHPHRGALAELDLRANRPARRVRMRRRCHSRHPPATRGSRPRFHAATSSAGHASQSGCNSMPTVQVRRAAPKRF